MSITQIPESDQKFIDSLSNIAIVEQDKQGSHVYILQIDDCQLRLEFNPDDFDQSPRWI